MGNVTPGLTFAGQAAQPGTVSPDTGAPAVEQPTHAEQSPAQYLTVPQLEEILRQRDEQWRKSVQSTVDKGTKRLEQRVQERFSAITSSLEALRKTGVVVTPEQESALRQQIIMDEIATPAAEPNQPQPGQVQAATQPNAPIEPTPAVPPEQHPVMRAAVSYMQQVLGGNVIADGDPEVSMIDQQTTDPGKFLASVVAATNAKAQRSKAAQQPQINPPAVTVPSLAVGAPGNALPDDPMTLLDMAYKK